MSAWAYYNEIDPFAAARLRAHIAAGRIMPGFVDERSIEDVHPDDLRGFTQVHFFAGIGVWSYALRRVGWLDEWPVWTGSCPCQPFSQAGKAGGFDDERHLWPAMHWLVGQRRPVVVFGEQSASSHANDWIDLVQSDVEALGYAFGAVAFPASSVGAPHIRDRAYWVAYADSQCREGAGHLWTPGRDESANRRATGGMDNAQRQRRAAGGQGDNRGHVWQQSCANDRNGGMADTGRTQQRVAMSARGVADLSRQWNESAKAAAGHCSDHRPLQVNGFWRDADWLHCRDGKWRPVKPGLTTMVNGASERVGRIRTYGNAINAEQAAAFIRAYLAGCRND